jgi:hypothetical protein
MKHSKEGRRNNLGNKELAAKLRAIEKANPGMKYRALFLSTIGDVAALESDGQVFDATVLIGLIWEQIHKLEKADRTAYGKWELLLVLAWLGDEKAYELVTAQIKSFAETKAAGKFAELGLDAAASEGS